MEKTRFDPGEFLNIDLEVKSRRSLVPLAKAWPWAQVAPTEGRRVPLWLQLNPRNYSRSRDHAEGTARALLRHVESLRGEALRCWDAAYLRAFDIGIRAGGPEHRPFQGVRLSAETLKRITAVGGEMHVTVYPAWPEGFRHTLKPGLTFEEEGL